LISEATVRSSTVEGSGMRGDSGPSSNARRAFVAFV